MSTIKKTVSVLLAVMMIFSMLTIASVSAAETTTGGTVTVSSNLCDDIKYTYDEDDTQVEVTYFLQSDKMILNAQGSVSYDSTVLELADTNTPATNMPVLSTGSAVINYKLNNRVKFNSTSLNLFDFTSKGTFVTFTFDIIGSGDTKVDLEVDIITATTAKNYDEVIAGATDVTLVYFGEYMTDEFTFSSEAEVIGKDAPDSEVSIFGDINLDLEQVDTTLYQGTVDLDAGTYQYRVMVDGTQYCFGGKYTDVMYGIKYSSEYSSATTFIATGGRYTFQYNTATNLLIITFKPYAELVELFGDVNVELLRATDTVFSGSVRLDAGEYSFRINDQGQQMCFGYKFTDSVVDIEFRPDWTSATTFVATGGIYTINYNTETNKLTFMHAPKGLGEVRIFGSVGIDLAVEKGTSYYSASKVLEAGEYTFRVDELGTTMCFGGKFTDTMWEIEYSNDYKAATTFVATGGKYTFRYNAETNKLVIFHFPLEEKVSVYGDINLDLQSADGVKYTGTTTLAAGTYSFRIDDFGTSYCFGGTQTDYIYNITYSKDYASATTFIATGGTYTFTYNKNTHVVNVNKIA